MSVLVTSICMTVLLFATRNRIPFCKIAIWEFEKVSAIQEVRIEMDSICEMRQGKKNTKNTVWCDR